jgi:hypothetical protein
VVCGKLVSQLKNIFSQMPNIPKTIGASKVTENSLLGFLSSLYNRKSDSIENKKRQFENETSHILICAVTDLRY